MRYEKQILLLGAWICFVNTHIVISFAQKQIYGANVVIFEGIMAFVNEEVVKVSRFFYILVYVDCLVLLTLHQYFSHLMSTSTILFNLLL